MKTLPTQTDLQVLLDYARTMQGNVEPPPSREQCVLAAACAANLIDRWVFNGISYRSRTSIVAARPHVMAETADEMAQEGKRLEQAVVMAMADQAGGTEAQSEKTPVDKQSEGHPELPPNPSVLTAADAKRLLTYADIMQSSDEVSYGIWVKKYHAAQAAHDLLRSLGFGTVKHTDPTLAGLEQHMSLFARVPAFRDSRGFEPVRAAGKALNKAVWAWAIEHEVDLGSPISEEMDVDSDDEPVPDPAPTVGNCKGTGPAMPPSIKATVLDLENYLANNGVLNTHPATLLKILLQYGDQYEKLKAVALELEYLAKLVEGGGARVASASVSYRIQRAHAALHAARLAGFDMSDDLAGRLQKREAYVLYNSMTEKTEGWNTMTKAEALAQNVCLHNSRSDFRYIRSNISASTAPSL